MPGPMPPQGPPPQSPPGMSPPPNQPPQNAGPGPQGGSELDGQSPAMKSVSMANDGLMQLADIFEKAKGEVSPQEQSQLAKIITDFQGLVASLSGQGGQGQPPSAKPPGGPMPAMAGKNSTPLDNQ